MHSSPAPHFAAVLVLLLACQACAQTTPETSSEDFARHAMKLREQALEKLVPKISLPTTARTSSAAGTYQWKQDIVTTTFTISTPRRGKKGAVHSASCWDPNWDASYGGYDDPAPTARLHDGQDFRPAAFIPRQNPFYCALPYNDVAAGKTKPEARTCIPWFRIAFVREGQSVCKDRWIAIRNRRNGRIAYAQWSDCGPFRTDHWQYVFGNERPRPNANGGAGLNVSPSVRDYLALSETDVLDWRFVEGREVPPGPWRKYGENNPFVQQARASAQSVERGKAAPPAKAPASTEVVPHIQIR